MEESNYGPKSQVANEMHGEKYRQKGETFYESQVRIAAATADNEEHRHKLKNIFLNQRFMPAGRIQSTVGSSRKATPFNCFVSGIIEDSMVSIMDKAKEAALTMQKGGGIGYDFSRLRPIGSRIVSIDSTASGPLSFMDVYDSVCRTILAAGHRRGAMMGVLRVDHPDIELFIRAKQDLSKLRNFNISVGVTDEFMRAVINDEEFELKFEGVVHKRVSAVHLWDEIMRSTYDYAEPGVLFIDRINMDNNLWYCELIEATNPCGEQPLPPYGACLLGSFNLTQYVTENGGFRYQQFQHDITYIVRAVDNIIDLAEFPLEEQREEAKAKRRMGLGITGLANTLEYIGIRYGSGDAQHFLKSILKVLRDTAYRTSVELAIEKGPFPLFDADLYCQSAYIQRLPFEIQELIRRHGIRNSHLTSIAPTGTISFCADNISSGIEPVFAHVVDRAVRTELGQKIVQVKDYAYETWGLKGITAEDLTTDDHLNTLIAAAPYIDSAISKTINVPNSTPFKEFSEVYMKAWKGGAKGCTTYRVGGKLEAILTKAEEETIEEGAACTYDPETGTKTCDL